MKTRLKYPPCQLGLFSEKPVRHEFEVALRKDGKPKTFVKNGITYYRSVCKRCKLNDPNPPLH